MFECVATVHDAIVCCVSFRLLFVFVVVVARVKHIVANLDNE